MSNELHKLMLMVLCFFFFFNAKISNHNSWFALMANCFTVLTRDKLLYILAVSRVPTEAVPTQPQNHSMAQPEGDL